MAIRDLPLDALGAIIRGVHPALAAGNDWIAAELQAVGISPGEDRAWLLMRKMEKSDCGLCKAKTRKGTACLALGAGRGGRCKNHGGESTGPKTDAGRKRALAALERYRGVRET